MKPFFWRIAFRTPERNWTDRRWNRKKAEQYYRSAISTHSKLPSPTSEFRFRKENATKVSSTKLLWSPLAQNIKEWLVLAKYFAHSIAAEVFESNSSLVQLTKKIPEFIRGQWRCQENFFFFDWMNKLEMSSVKTNAFIRIGLIKTILHIAHDRAVHWGKLHSNLMWPSRERIYFH